MNKHLRDTLLKIGDRADTIAYGTLNRGGCCVYAALVGRRLLELGVPVRGIAAGERGYDANDRAIHLARIRPKVRHRNLLSDWEINGNGLDIHHVGLRIGRGKDAELYDSNGFSRFHDSLSGETVIPGTLSIPELEGLASVPDNWNSMFDRHLIPKLQTLINNMLEVS